MQKMIPRVKSFFLALALAAACLSFQDGQQAHASDGGGSEFFEAKIRPLLITACYDCHAEAARGGLRVDSREALLKGGARGPAIVVGKPEESLLLKSVEHLDPALKMPKGGPKLKDEQIAALSQWIKDGAVWPAAAKMAG